MACDPLIDTVGCVVGAATGSPLDDLASNVSDAVGQLISALGSVWATSTAHVASASTGAASAPVAFLQSSLGYYTAALAILAIMIGGARTAWERRAAPARETLGAVIRLVVVSGAGLTVIALLIVAADSFSTWILDSATDGGSFQDGVTALVVPSSDDPPLPLIVIILGLVTILTAVLQIMLMVIRSGMLVVLAGALPLSASFTNTEAGRNWFGKITAWTLALILYKPAAAIVYATAFRLTGKNAIVGGEDPTGLVSVMAGLALMIMALVVLPALMRLLAPMTSVIATGGSRVAFTGASAPLPTGARPVGRTAGTRTSPPQSVPGRPSGARPAAGLVRQAAPADEQNGGEARGS